MKTEPSELQRLDLAAKSQFDGLSSGTHRVVMTVLSLFIALLAIVSIAPPQETFLLRLIAVVALASVVVSWLRWRYAGYGWTALLLAMAVEVLVSHDYSRTALGWTARLCYVFFFVFMSLRYWKSARGLTIIQGDDWKKKLDQVQEWVTVLKKPDSSQQVLQFSSESFWTGYFTYRLLNTGFCWVVAKFKKGDTRRIIECRVLELNAVRQTERPRGELSIEINNRSIPKVKASSDMQARLLSSLNAR